MLDIRWIRDNPEAFDRALTRRGMTPLAESVLAHDREWRAAQTRAEQLQAEVVFSAAFILAHVAVTLHGVQ